MFIKAALSVLLCSVTLTIAFKTYEGYKIYDVTARNEVEKEILVQMSANDDYDFFTLPKLYNDSATVMVAPNDQLVFKNTLTEFRMKFNIVNGDVSKEISLSHTNASNSYSPRHINFKSFPRFAEINDYLDQLARDYPHRAVVKTLGKSHQGRNIKMIRITGGGDWGGNKRKTIFVDAGVHAREWIAPVTALYIIHQLVENYHINKNLLQSYDWVVIPIVNPDGYEYSHTTNRLWRKTMKSVTKDCFGTDGNRNFDFQWGLNGASSDPCNDKFKGKKAFSEPETKLIRDMMHKLTGHAKMYLSLHSFGSYLLYPWGWSSELPSNWRDIYDVAQAGATAIRTATGTKYKVGSTANVLYAAAGGSADYALAKAKIPISITMELPRGGTGFDPPPSKIMPMASESWIGIKAMAEKVIEKL